MKGYRVFWMIWLVMCLAYGLILARDFFRTCSDGPGNGLTCEITLGMKAKISGPAMIKVISSDQFSIVIDFGSEKTDPIEAVKADGLWYETEFRTGVDMTIYMIRDRSDGLLGPIIIVDQLEPGTEYPRLSVSRSNQNPIGQLLRWDIFGLFLAWLVFVLVLAMSAKPIFD